MYAFQHDFAQYLSNMGVAWLAIVCLWFAFCAFKRA